jgi:hypothetical protein
MPSLPAEPVLHAAGRWVQHLRHSSAARARAIFTAHPDYTDLTPTQYETALSWLEEMGMVSEDGLLRCDLNSVELALLEATVLHARPLWLRDADQLITSPDDLPDDVIMAGQALGLGPSEALAAVRTAWGKVDTTTRAELGAAGEAALTELLRDLTGVRVIYVAEYADGLGYDIRAEAADFRANLEVKTTTRRGRLTVYLSRNEFEVMRGDANWRLVVVLLGSERRADAVGTVDSSWISRQAPTDTSPLGRWESVRLDIPPGIVLGGLSSLGSSAIRQLGDQHLLRKGTGEKPPAWLTS